MSGLTSVINFLLSQTLFVHKIQKGSKFKLLPFFLLSLNCKAGDLNLAGASCVHVDFRESKCLPPNINQTDTNFCFAFAAAQAVGFRLCKEISSVALGIMSSPPKDATTFPSQLWSGYGNIEEAVNAGNKNGFCLEAEVPSQMLFNDKTYALQREYQNLKLKIAQLKKKHCENAVEQTHLILPAIQTSEIIKYIASDQTNTDFKKLLISNCKTRITEKVVIKSCRGGAKEKLDFIDENITTGPIPIEVIGEPDSGGIIKISNFNLGHAVAIIGRKIENGTCKYLIRDSAAMPYWFGSFELGNESGSERWLTRDDLLNVLKFKNSSCISVN